MWVERGLISLFRVRVLDSHVGVGVRQNLDNFAVNRLRKLHIWGLKGGEIYCLFYRFHHSGVGIIHAIVLIFQLVNICLIRQQPLVL